MADPVVAAESYRRLFGLPSSWSGHVALTLETTAERVLISTGSKDFTNPDLLEEMRPLHRSRRNSGALQGWKLVPFNQQAFDWLDETVGAPCNLEGTPPQIKSTRLQYECYANAI